jgi:hypothetical protein
MSETVLKTNEEIPPELKTLELEGWKVEIAKSTYEANNPSEDRSTVVIDPDNKYIFAGVWDGHGASPLRAPTNSGNRATDFVIGMHFQPNQPPPREKQARGIELDFRFHLRHTPAQVARRRLILWKVQYGPNSKRCLAKLEILRRRSNNLTERWTRNIFALDERCKTPPCC